MSIDELILEAVQAKDRFWFVQALEIVERTNATVTLHFTISPNLFIRGEIGTTQCAVDAGESAAVEPGVKFCFKVIVVVKHYFLFKHHSGDYVRRKFYSKFSKDCFAEKRSQ